MDEKLVMPTSPVRMVRTFRTLCGTFPTLGGLATLAAINSPQRVTVDPYGNLYIADFENNRIRRICAATGIITTVAGTGGGAFQGDNGPSTLAAVDLPSDIALDAAGNLYIAEQGNNRIRKITVKACNNDTDCPCFSQCEGTICSFIPLQDNSACNDGIFCNGFDQCSGGRCFPSNTNPCAGGAFCASTCNETFHTCNLPDDTSCGSGYACQAGSCAATLPPSNTNAQTSATAQDIAGVVAPAVVVPVVILLAVIMVLLLLFYRFYKQKTVETDFPMSNIFTIASCLVTGVTVKETIGSGNFGSVTKGVWNEGNEVALKKLNDPERVKEFLAEAKLLQSLRHPNIVQFFGIYMDGETPLLVMEFMNKGSLQNLLQIQGDKLTPKQLEQAVIDTLKGMAFLESKNVIHCDLATRNLLVASKDQDFIVKVGDFGMGKVTSSKAYYSKDSKFPVKWAAPEVINFLKFSFKSDVWSFGKG